MKTQFTPPQWPYGWRGIVVRLMRRVLPASLQRQLFSLFFQVGSGLYEAHFRVLSLEWSLHNLRKIEFLPATIIDVGAYTGAWTRLASAIFPEAEIIMVEPQPGKREHLERIARESGGSIRFVNRLLGPKPASHVPFNLMEQGSSILEENTLQSRTVAHLEMTTLKELSRQMPIKTPALLKLDAQGYELEILRGAEDTLETFEFILMEISTLDYIKGAPGFAEVTAFMKSRGYVLYDICDIRRRHKDEVMLQLDAIFARENGAFRQKSNTFDDKTDICFA